MSHQPSRSFTLRLGLLIGAAIIATGLFALAVYDTVTTVQIHGPLYARIAQSSDLIADTLPPPLYVVESYLVTLELLNADSTHRPSLLDQFKRHEQEFDQKLAEWQQRLPPGPLHDELFSASSRSASEFYAQWNREFLPAVERGDIQTMTSLAYGPLTSRFQQHRQQILQLVQLAGVQRDQIERNAVAVLEQRTYLLGLLGFGLLCSIFLVGWLINRHVSHPLMQGLRESEERTRSIVNTALDAVIVMDDQGMITDWNPQAELVLGWPEAAVLGRKLSETIIPLKYREAHETGLRHYLETGEGPVLGKRLEITALRRDGVEIAVELAITPLRLAAGTTFSAFVRDVSERKRAEDALRTSESRLAMTVQGSNVGIYDWDIDHHTVFFSPEWKSILGYADDEIQHEFHEWESRLHPDDHDRALKTVASHLSGESSHFELEHRLLHKNGEYRWISARGLAQRDEQGKPHRMVGIVFDITEKKRSEEELRLAKEAAEAASVAKSQFLANMSHEIRTPMNGVLGMTELLLTLDLTTQQRHLAETVQRSARSLLGIINDILDFSKIEAGKLKLEEVDIDPRQLCKDVADMFTEPMRRKGLAFVSCIGESVPTHLRGDPVRLRQILMNLLSNAVKFTDAGTISLTLNKIGEDRQGTVVRLEVQDTGIGIPSDAQQRIFQAFDQADTSTTRKYGGTGLGLAIVNRLIEMMNGRVGVRSTPGQGTTFWAVLRLLNSADAASPTDHDSSKSHDQGDRFSANFHASILLAEDNAVNREVAIGMLELLGCQIDAVDNGRLASAAAKRKYDLIFMDCQMPELDGFTATALIRERELVQKTDRTPIIALTARAIEGDREQCLEAGMDDYLTKPFTLKQLIDILNRWLPPSRTTVAAVQSGSHSTVDEQQNDGTQTDPPQIDHRAWDVIRAMQRPGQPNILHKTLSVYLTHSEQLLAQLRRAVSEHDTPAVHTIAHTLKSSSAQLGAHRLADRCAHVESACRAGVTDGLPEICSQLVSEHHAVCAAFKQEIHPTQQEAA